MESRCKNYYDYNIIRMLDYWRYNNDYYFAMIHHRCNLRQILNINDKSLPFIKKMDIIRQIVTAIDAMHNKIRCIIVDLKPENILLTFTKGKIIVELCDFGNIYIIDMKHTVGGGRIAGTLHYLSPECLLLQKCRISHDIWSFGILLFELLCNKCIQDQIDTESETENESVESIPVANEQILPKNDINDSIEKLPQRMLDVQMFESSDDSSESSDKIVINKRNPNNRNNQNNEINNKRKSDYLNMLKKIAQYIGPMNKDCMKLFNINKNSEYFEIVTENVEETVIGSVDYDGLKIPFGMYELVVGCLNWNPHERPTIDKIAVRVESETIPLFLRPK